MSAAEGHVHAYVPGESFAAMVRRIATEDGVDLFEAGRICWYLGRPMVGHAASEEERWARYAAYVCENLATLPRAELAVSVPGPAGDVDLDASVSAARADIERMIATGGQIAYMSARTILTELGQLEDAYLRAIRELADCPWKDRAAELRRANEEATEALADTEDSLRAARAERDAAVARADTLAAKVDRVREREAQWRERSARAAEAGDEYSEGFSDGLRDAAADIRFDLDRTLEVLARREDALLDGGDA